MTWFGEPENDTNFSFKLPDVSKEEKTSRSWDCLNSFLEDISHGSHVESAGRNRAKTREVMEILW